jgi:hypothetical protein
MVCVSWWHDRRMCLSAILFCLNKCHLSGSLLSCHLTGVRFNKCNLSVQHMWKNTSACMPSVLRRILRWLLSFLIKIRQLLLTWIQTSVSSVNRFWIKIGRNLSRGRAMRRGTRPRRHWACAFVCTPAASSLTPFLLLALDSGGLTSVQHENVKQTLWIRE